MSGKTARTVVAAVPVVLVNGVAFAGQLAFLRDHLPWPLAGQVMMATALESIAIYLAFHAHVASLANDSALRLRLASYGLAAVIAVMNYSHYAGPGWRPTFPAVAVGLMSAASPWLWAVHSRRASRDRMIEAGLIEPRAVRLGVTRWLWHPVRSARVMSHATWVGTTDPRQAIAGWEASLRPAEPEPAAVSAASPATEGQADGLVSQGRPPAASRSAQQSAGRSAGASGEDAEKEFAAEIAAGQVPSLNQIRTRLHVGSERAKVLRQHVARQALTA